MLGGLSAVSGGSWLLGGAGVGLVVGGLLAILYGAAAMDTDEPPADKREA